MNIRKFGMAICVTMFLVMVVHLTNPPPAAASIHESSRHFAEPGAKK